MKKLLLVFVLVLLLGSTALAFSGYVATDYDLEAKDFVTSLHLQKNVFWVFHAGVTTSTIPGETLLPSGLGYELWAAVQLGSWSVKFSALDDYFFLDPVRPDYKYVLRLRYDF